MTRSLLSAVLVVACVASPALADKVTRAVSYRDLDLTQPEGVKTLRYRIGRAVTVVCGDAGPADLLMQEDVRACREHANAGADAQIAMAISHARYASAAPSGVLISSR